ncbi:MAG: hypothetical protein HQL44_08020 [Alphaproteobacteria bacterium]|nr:hypothetical protein [Alphaproteobacteria bacterium]
MEEATPFQLSRIYASGWNEGRKFALEDIKEVADLVRKLNPHQSPTEQERWNQGFRDAVFNDNGGATAFRRSQVTSGG